VAMAGGRDIAWRVDRILTGGETETAPGAGRRLLAAAGILGVSITIAGVHAAMPAQAAPPQHRAQPRANMAATGTPDTRRADTVPAPATRPATRPAPVRTRAQPLYDPRALLRDPAAINVRGVMVLTRG